MPPFYLLIRILFLFSCLYNLYSAVCISNISHSVMFLLIFLVFAVPSVYILTSGNLEGETTDERMKTKIHLLKIYTHMHI